MALDLTKLENIWKPQREHDLKVEFHPNYRKWDSKKGDWVKVEGWKMCRSFYDWAINLDKYEQRNEGAPLPIRIHNTTWEDTIKLTGHSRGQSAAYFTLVSLENGISYYAFMKDMVDTLIPCMVNGVAKGTFTFQKRGQNVGIRLTL